MSSRRDLFPGGIQERTTSPSVADSGEISLREELDSILNGTSGEVPKGRIFILRRLRVNDDGSPVECICSSEDIYHHADHTYPCPYCNGVGFLFDEETFVGYKVIVTSGSGFGASTNRIKEEYGSLLVEELKFYLPYNVEPSTNDRIVEVEYDVDGNVTLPFVRTTAYEIALVRPIVGDYGRIEYYICHVTKNYQGTEGNVG